MVKRNFKVIWEETVIILDVFHTSRDPGNQKQIIK